MTCYFCQTREEKPGWEWQIIMQKPVKGDSRKAFIVDFPVPRCWKCFYFHEFASKGCGILFLVIAALVGYPCYQWDSMTLFYILMPIGVVTYVFTYRILADRICGFFGTRAWYVVTEHPITQRLLQQGWTEMLGGQQKVEGNKISLEKILNDELKDEVDYQPPKLPPLPSAGPGPVPQASRPPAAAPGKLPGQATPPSRPAGIGGKTKP